MSDIYVSGESFKLTDLLQKRVPLRGNSKTVVEGSFEQRLSVISRVGAIGMPKKLSRGDICEKLRPLLEAGIFKLIMAERLSPIDPEYVGYKVGQPNPNPVVVNKLQYSSLGADGVVYGALKTIPADREGLDEYVIAFERANTYISTNGPEIGLYTRLLEGLGRYPRFRLDEAFALECVDSILSYEVQEATYRSTDLMGAIEAAEERGWRVNPSTDKGYPYNKMLRKDFLDQDICQQALEVAGVMLDMAEKGKLLDFVKNNNDLFLVMLKNKADRYLRSEIDKKIRPYGVFPLHERILYGISNNLLKAKLFYDGGYSAIGFSWEYGGGDKLYNWVLECARAVPDMYCCGYGDNLLWVCVTEDGSPFVISPDVKSMDMSLVSGWSRVCEKKFLHAMPYVSGGWKTICRFNCYRAFSHRLVVESDIHVWKTKGLLSGIPGTSRIDEVAGATISSYMRAAYRKKIPQNLTQLKIFLEQGNMKLSDKFGMAFKPETLEPYKFEPEQDKYDWDFLGKTLRKVTLADGSFHYVPSSEMYKLLLTITHPRRYLSPGEMEMRRCEMLRVVYSSGGYLYPYLRQVLRNAFDGMRSRGIKPEGTYYDEVELTMPYIKFAHDDFPSYTEALNLYLPEGAQQKEIVAAPAPVEDIGFNEESVVGSDHTPTPTTPIPNPQSPIKGRKAGEQSVLRKAAEQVLAPSRADEYIDWAEEEGFGKSVYHSKEPIMKESVITEQLSALTLGKPPDPEAQKRQAEKRHEYAIKKEAAELKKNLKELHPRDSASNVGRAAGKKRGRRSGTSKEVQHLLNTSDQHLSREDEAALVFFE